jgi:hypothetical protein
VTGREERPIRRTFTAAAGARYDEVVAHLLGQPTVEVLGPDGAPLFTIDEAT